MDYALELNIGLIARYVYSRSTGNYDGAVHISGTDAGLLTSEAINDAQKFTTTQAKMQAAIKAPAGKGGGGGSLSISRPKGGGKGFVPESERVCHYCKLKGHIMANCPKKASDEKK